jgi:hypothetical protein
MVGERFQAGSISKGGEKKLSGPEYHRLSAYNQQNCISHSSGAREAQDQDA